MSKFQAGKKAWAFILAVDSRGKWVPETEAAWSTVSSVPVFHQHSVHPSRCETPQGRKTLLWFQILVVLMLTTYIAVVFRSDSFCDGSLTVVNCSDGICVCALQSPVLTSRTKEASLCFHSHLEGCWQVKVGCLDPCIGCLLTCFPERFFFFFSFPLLLVTAQSNWRVVFLIANSGAKGSCHGKRGSPRVLISEIRMPSVFQPACCPQCPACPVPDESQCQNSGSFYLPDTGRQAPWSHITNKAFSAFFLFFLQSYFHIPISVFRNCR